MLIVAIAGVGILVASPQVYVWGSGIILHRGFTRKAAPPEAYIQCIRGCRLNFTSHVQQHVLVPSTNKRSCQISSSLCCPVAPVLTRCDGRILGTTQQPTIFPKHGGRSQTDPEVRAVLLLDLHLLSSRLRLQHYDLGSVG